MLTKLIGIVAIAHQDVIGYDGQIPWPKIKEDLRHFKEMTSGHAVVMGRKTYDSIGRPLPNRDNIILTKDKTWGIYPNKVEPVVKTYDLEDCLQYLSLMDYEYVFVIGGTEIFQLFGHMIDRWFITRVDWELSELGVDIDPDKVVRFSWPDGDFDLIEYPYFKRHTEEEPRSWLEEYVRVHI